MHTSTRRRQAAVQSGSTAWQTCEMFASAGLIARSTLLNSTSRSLSQFDRRVWTCTRRMSTMCSCSNSALISTFSGQLRISWSRRSIGALRRVLFTDLRVVTRRHRIILRGSACRTTGVEWAAIALPAVKQFSHRHGRRIDHSHGRSRMSSSSNHAEPASKTGSLSLRAVGAFRRSNNSTECSSAHHRRSVKPNPACV
jgi:hypothetical protein